MIQQTSLKIHLLKQAGDNTQCANNVKMKTQAVPTPFRIAQRVSCSLDHNLLEKSSEYAQSTLSTLRVNGYVNNELLGQLAPISD